MCEATTASSQTNPGWALDRIDQTDLPLSNTFDSPTTNTNRTHIYVLDQAIRGYFPNTSLIHNDLAHVKAPDTHADDHVHFRSDIDEAIRNSLACTIHGTAVAGVIAGARTGVARNSLLHSYAIFDCQSPAVSDTFQIKFALNRILENHHEYYPNERAVINLSALTVGSVELVQLIRDLAAQSIITIVPMGNNGVEGCQGLLSIPETIAVGATGSRTTSGGVPVDIDTREEFSNYGTCTDIYAPGSSVTTTAAASPSSLSTETGVSFASAFVTGVVATFLEQNPTASMATVLSAIKSNASLNKIRNVPEQGGDNDLLNICFLEGACDPVSPEPATINSVLLESTCPDSFGIRLFLSNITQDHRIGVNYNPFDLIARVPPEQIVSTTHGSISWCIPPSNQLDQILRWDLTIEGTEIYLTDPTGTVIDGPVFLQRSRPSSGTIEAPGFINYSSDAGGSDVFITRSSDTRVVSYEFFASSDNIVTSSDNLLAVYATNPNNLNPYFFRFELDGTPAPFDPGPGGSNDDLPAGIWYLGARACDSSGNCSAITSSNKSTISQ